MSLAPAEVVKKFWELMETNDFQSVGLLHCWLIIKNHDA